MLKGRCFLRGDSDSKQDNGGYLIMFYFSIWLLITWIYSVTKTNWSVQLLFLYLSVCKYNYYIEYYTYYALIETLKNDTTNLFSLCLISFNIQMIIPSSSHLMNSVIAIFSVFPASSIIESSQAYLHCFLNQYFWKKKLYNHCFALKSHTSHSDISFSRFCWTVPAKFCWTVPPLIHFVKERCHSLEFLSTSVLQDMRWLGTASTMEKHHHTICKNVFSSYIR